jgi:hypothetical protein
MISFMRESSDNPRTISNLKFAFLPRASIFLDMKRFDYDVAVIGGGSGGYLGRNGRTRSASSR